MGYVCLGVAWCASGRGGLGLGLVTATDQMLLAVTARGRYPQGCLACEPDHMLSSAQQHRVISNSFRVRFECRCENFAPTGQSGAPAAHGLAHVVRHTNAQILQAWP